MDKYKQGFFFSYEFVGDNSWNGYEHKCLFANVGGGQFIDVARPTGSDSVKDGRGVAVADFNNDGRLDLVMNSNNETPVLYLNNLKKVGNSVELKLVGTASNRDAIGACVRLTAGGKTMMRQVEAGSGYASQMMLPLHFGLGKVDRVDAIEIRWPSGRVQHLEGQELAAMMKGSRQLRVEEGSDSYPQITQR
ncbi:MAG TPA: CRTAC1 family protein [Pyrinomonadaceae bacterium]|nr:CRTAC1 family protein [Pyrinomonadaceae bacterium]